jgi:hypothetical protein
MQTNLTDLLSKSILDPEMNAFMVKYDLPLQPELQLDIHGHAYDTAVMNTEHGIYLNFDGYYRYKFQYGEPALRLTTDDNELFLDEFTIDTEFTETKKQPVMALPFGLVLGDTSEDVMRKLDKKPFEKSAQTYGHCLWTRFDNFRILTAINPAVGLIWVRIIQLTVEEKEIERLKKQLPQQNKNIKPGNSSKIAAYTEILPTTAWRRRKDEGDELFTDKAIDAVDTALKKYATTLIELTNEKKAPAIYNSIKKIVMALNSINDKHNGFIETMEREELCDFINTIVRMTGLEIEPTIDLTEQWREW